MTLGDGFPFVSGDRTPSYQGAGFLYWGISHGSGEMASPCIRGKAATDIVGTPPLVSTDHFPLYCEMTPPRIKGWLSLIYWVDDIP